MATGKARSISPVLAAKGTCKFSSHASNNRTMKNGDAIYGGSAATGIPTLTERHATSNPRWWPASF